MPSYYYYDGTVATCIPFYYILYAFSLSLSLSLDEGNISLVQSCRRSWVGFGVVRAWRDRRGHDGFWWVVSPSPMPLSFSQQLSLRLPHLSLSDWRLTQAPLAIILPSNAKPRPPLATVSPSNDCEISSAWACSEISLAIVRSLVWWFCCGGYGVVVAME